MLSDLKNLVISYLELEVILTRHTDQKLISKLLKDYKLPDITTCIRNNSLKSVQYLLDINDCLQMSDYQLAKGYPIIFNYLSNRYMGNVRVN